MKRAKEEKEDRARVRDVVEGWSHEGVEGQVVGGLEFEKGLRKTAQRGGECPALNTSPFLFHIRLILA